VAAAAQKGASTGDGAALILIGDHQRSPMRTKRQKQRSTRKGQQKQHARVTKWCHLPFGGKQDPHQGEEQEWLDGRV